MLPNQVPAELVQQVADIILSRAIYEGREGDGVTQEDREDYAPYGHCLDAAERILAAVLPEIQAQALRDAARDIRAAHKVGPGSRFDGRVETWRKGMARAHGIVRDLSRAARLAATTEEPT